MVLGTNPMLGCTHFCQAPRRDASRLCTFPPRKNPRVFFDQVTDPQDMQWPQLRRSLNSAQTKLCWSNRLEIDSAQFGYLPPQTRSISQIQGRTARCGPSPMFQNRNRPKWLAFIWCSFKTKTVYPQRKTTSPKQTQIREYLLVPTLTNGKSASHKHPTTPAAWLWVKTPFSPQ